MEELEVGVYTRAREGEFTCGDACLVKDEAGIFNLAVVDGIGHGPEAARAAAAAIACLETGLDVGLENIFRRCHQRLMGTRGAVAALCRVDKKKGLWQAAVVGNILLQILAGKIVTPLTTPGILGYNYPRRLLIDRGPYQEGDLFLIHSDGIQEGAVSPAALVNSPLPPQELARLIGEEHGRRDDDVAVIVAR
ncbi:SpoIIE family protein phosphatase [Moorella sp. Hama-1]|uniref:SpoIIE family protein phosphatase n=1 Tax=Moorella sp. Hama-1 TaxID=2138101 RepID=UPI000D64F26C|nr:SpoIIE family protein phosphatase [Moorella sp. Hama-1]BCV21734.1 serine phosphatase [Moorella sp. Hama-1]